MTLFCRKKSKRGVPFYVGQVVSGEEVTYAAVFSITIYFYGENNCSMQRLKPDQHREI